MAGGFGILHRLGDRLYLTTDFQYTAYWDGKAAPGPDEAFSGEFEPTTDLRAWRVTLGIMARVTPTASQWEVYVRGAFGVAGIVSGRLPPGSQEEHEDANGGLNEDVLALTGGLELTRNVGSSIQPYVRIQVDGYMLGEWLFGLSLLNPQIPESGWLVGIPVQLGVRFHF